MAAWRASWRRLSTQRLEVSAQVEDLIVKALPTEGEVLEVGSGTGLLMADLAKKLPQVRFQPSDVTRVTINGPNILPAVLLDVTASHWGAVELRRFDAILAIDLLPFASLHATNGLFDGACRLLKQQGSLIIVNSLSVTQDNDVGMPCDPTLLATKHDLEEYGHDHVDDYDMLMYRRS